MGFRSNPVRAYPAKYANRCHNCPATIDRAVFCFVKADRLLSALLLLQAHGRLTGRELGRRLEVSLRTVHRDMESLSAAGVPVVALRGARGGWQLDAGWRTRVPGLDEAELRALLMAQPRVLGDARLARAAERAIDKLLASLPPPLRDQAAAIRQRLHVDTTGWYGREDLQALPVVQDAVSMERKLALRYRRPSREATEATVDPLGLVAKGGTWYLVAGTREGARTYRVSRIEAARMRDEPCVRPAGFDLEAYWKSSTEELKKTWTRYEARLRATPAAARSIGSWRPESNVTELRADGDRVEIQAFFDDENQACFVVMGYGPSVEVLEPASLRARVVADLTAALERHRSGPSASLEPTSTRPR
jgi:predicted DNA-binding transcriptional regulator YafY